MPISYRQSSHARFGPLTQNWTVDVPTEPKCAIEHAEFNIVGTSRHFVATDFKWSSGGHNVSIQFSYSRAAPFPTRLMGQSEGRILV